MTASQRAILAKLRAMTDEFGPPSLRELAEAVGARSKGGVLMNLRRLEALGLVQQRRGRFVAKEIERAS